MHVKTCLAAAIGRDHQKQKNGKMFFYISSTWLVACTLTNCKSFQDEVNLAINVPKPINLDQCIFCQRKKASEYLCSGDTGRSNIISLAQQKSECNDVRVVRVLKLTAQEQTVMKYHTSSCYRNFLRDIAKTVPLVQPLEQPEACQVLEEPMDRTSEPRSKRFKPATSSVCIICGSERATVKRKTVHKLYRICEKPMAQKLLNAARLFKDRVYTEIAAMSGVGDVFAADVQYHDHCFKGYFNKYHAEIDEIMKNLEEEDLVTAEDDSLKARFRALELDFAKSAHSLTSIRDRLNEGSVTPVSNRVVKQLIIELYGGAVCFTYPSNKRISQMVLATNSSPGALVESLRVSPLQQVATELEHELKQYSFGLKKSLCEPRDLQLSMDAFTMNQPPKWAEFCSYVFKGKKTSQLKKDVVFQIMHYILSDGKEPTPFHVAVAQAVHSLTRSKELVTALNHHGICVSYNTVKRIDVDLAEQVIATAGNNRVPLPPIFEGRSPLNGALDNFDRNESTLAGKGSTHDTILVLFQNVPSNLEKPSQGSEISTRPLISKSRTTVKLRSTVGCQQLIRMGPVKERGEISPSYTVSEPHSSSASLVVDPTEVSTSGQAEASTSGQHPLTSTDDPTVSSTTGVDLPINRSATATKSIASDYFLWMVNRFLKQSTQECSYFPGFTAVRSAVVNCNFHSTTTVLTPILPYPATTYDAILTTMINFQDALKQKGDTYGGLWADEGVYCIAKEIQLLKPDQFDNIFLGLGGFHMEKIILACLGSYLEPSGIFSALVETECYGTDVIKAVISGSHYVRARTAHSLIHEALMSMLLEAFLLKYPERRLELQSLQVNSKALTGEDWKTTKKVADGIQAAFDVYLSERASSSQSFNYWKTYITDLFPILRDLTNSLRSGYWHLYLSAIERATSLFFFFGRTNYCRWTPLFLQDCYQLKEKFPLLYDSYSKGGFVVNTTKKGSGVPFDQALEQCYNRPAKVSGGVIGVTRKKDAVALWAIIKHKKDEYVDLLKTKDDDQGELSLHHDFNPSTTTLMVTMVQEIKEYLLKVCNPLKDQANLKNVITGEIVTNVEVSKLVSCLKDGSTAYAKFIDDRLKERSLSIHATISKIKYVPPKTASVEIKTDVKGETIKALMFIEYGCHRGFTMDELLQHEITNSSFFLVDKDGYLRKSVKSQLGTELLKLCPLVDKRGPETSPPTHAMVIDFMALVRKVPLKKLNPPVKTFHDFAATLMSMITRVGQNCDAEIHIVFDSYREDSIKNAERKRRGKNKEMIVLDVISPNQNVPVLLENFWSSSVSKTAFQAFFAEWISANYRGTKPIYLGLSPQAWVVSARGASPFPRLNCTHEEADDRIMFHIHDILSNQSGPTSITVYTGDTDVFVCLLYHITVNWRNLGLQELWLIRNSGVKRSILPLHDISTALGDEVTRCLPALHALTGCDTTSKVSTKAAALKAISKPEQSSLILNFDHLPLTDDAVRMAELFLVKCLKPSTDLETFNDLRVDAFNSNALKLDFEKTPCTSVNARKHILRAYYQQQLWVRAPFEDVSLSMNAESYGFIRSGDLLVPDIVASKPEDLPDPCTCGKCARKNGCPCRVAEIRCCKYCKCKAGDLCKNPVTE